MAPLVEQLLQAHSAGSAPRTRRAPPRTDRRLDTASPAKLVVRPRVATAKLSSWQSSFAENFQTRDFRKDDLRPYYHLNLKEAAGRLGICATTLKRVCRRLGVRKWPRRALAKLSQQKVREADLDQLDELPLVHADPGTPALQTAASRSGSSDASLHFEGPPSPPAAAAHPWGVSPPPGMFLPAGRLVSGPSSPQSDRTLSVLPDARDWDLPDFAPAFGINEWPLDPVTPKQHSRHLPVAAEHQSQAPGLLGQIGSGHSSQPDLLPFSDNLLSFSPPPSEGTWQEPPSASHPFPAASDWGMLQHILDSPAREGQPEMQQDARPVLPGITSPIWSPVADAGITLSNPAPFEAGMGASSPSFPSTQQSQISFPHFASARLPVLPPPAAVSLPGSFSPPVQPDAGGAHACGAGMQAAQQHSPLLEHGGMFGPADIGPILRGRVMTSQECQDPLEVPRYLGICNPWALPG